MIRHSRRGGRGGRGGPGAVEGEEGLAGIVLPAVCLQRRRRAEAPAAEVAVAVLGPQVPNGPASPPPNTPTHPPTHPPTPPGKLSQPLEDDPAARSVRWRREMPTAPRECDGAERTAGRRVLIPVPRAGAPQPPYHTRYRSLRQEISALLSLTGHTHIVRGEWGGGEGIAIAFARASQGPAPAHSVACSRGAAVAHRRNCAAMVSTSGGGGGRNAASSARAAGPGSAAAAAAGRAGRCAASDEMRRQMHELGQAPSQVLMDMSRQDGCERVYLFAYVQIMSAPNRCFDSFKNCIEASL